MAVAPRLITNDPAHKPREKQKDFVKWRYRTYGISVSQTLANMSLEEGDTLPASSVFAGETDYEIIESRYVPDKGGVSQGRGLVWVEVLARKTVMWP